MSTIEAAASDLLDVIDRRIGGPRDRMWRGIVTAFDAVAWKVSVRRPEHSAADPVSYPYIGNAVLRVGDDVLMVDPGGTPALCLGVVTPAALPVWTAFPFSANWTNYDTSDYGPCAYMRDAAGRVHCRGLAKPVSTQAVGSTIGTFPVGYWPAGPQPILSGGAYNGTNNGVARTGIAPAGGAVVFVEWLAAPPAGGTSITTGGWYSLNQVSFYAG